MCPVQNATQISLQIVWFVQIKLGFLPQSAFLFGPTERKIFSHVKIYPAAAALKVPSIKTA